MGLQLSRNMNQADPIIIVGLGGLGGGVIDSLKGKIKHDYDDIDRVEMRIVDMTSHIKNIHMMRNGYQYSDRYLVIKASHYMQKRKL